MKLKKNSLITKIWIYLIVFSLSILVILWFIQVVFFNTYYENEKTKDIEQIALKIKKNYKKETFSDIIDDISFDRGVCIEVISDEIELYSKDATSRGCLPSQGNYQLTNYKIRFINSNLKEQSYNIKDNKFNNKILLHALKLDDYYIFINVSLEPSGWVTEVLRGQLLYISIIILILSLIIAYFISKKISSPIIKINNSAKKMAKGEYDVVFTVSEDIEEINELSNTLKNTCEELSKTEELRRELLANVSHDLKTPMTMIKAYAEMVRDITYKDKKKREENLNVIIDEVNRLNNLVNDILELSKMQADVVCLNIEEFDINNMVNNIVKKFNYLEEQDICHFKITNHDKIIVKADYMRMEQVLYNLLSNAINYVGKDKMIIINVIVKDKVRVEIIDHGKGIEEKDLKLVWDKYSKIDKTYKRNTNGTGLGLSIVKNILIMHHFDYGVLSKKGKGTTFYFEIPVNKG